MTMKFAFVVLFSLPALVQAGGLEFKELTKKQDAALDATTVVTEFPFTNTSGKTIAITKADPTCSCLKVEISGGKLKYAPGESGVIRTSFDVGNVTGDVEKGVAVFVDGDPESKPSLYLTVDIHIPVLVELEPSTLSWVMGDKPESKTIHIQMADGNRINVVGIKSSSESFTCELKTIEKGSKYELVVTPKVMDTPGLGIFRIETDSTISKQKVRQAFASVKRPVVAKESARK